MVGKFVHQIDPIFTQVAGVYLWWYGLSYAVGFLGIHLRLRRIRQRLELALHEVYDLTILFALGVLIGGRAVEVVFYEWPYYVQHPWRIPACWLGGMSTHGVLLGGTVGVWVFCGLRGRSVLATLDEFVIPGAFFMGVGRIGNFIDGQIVGRVTDVWWAVQFPDADGFRHPVVLYDGLKNFLLIPLLLYVRKRGPAPGMVMAHFVFWYGFLRIFVDIFREYPTHLLGMATGQNFNIFMSVLGASLFLWCSKKGKGVLAHASVPIPSAGAVPGDPISLWARRIVLIVLMLFSLTIPSDWTQDIPARYGKRHPGLRYTFLYPRT